MTPASHPRAMASLKLASSRILSSKELTGGGIQTLAIHPRTARFHPQGCFQGARAHAVAGQTTQPASPVAKPASQYTGKERVDILAEALPFIQRFQGKTVVVKYGGAAMKDESLKDGVIKDLVLLSCVGMKCVLVHGGGPEINQWLGKLGIAPEFKNGLRVTDAATMEVVEMVLVGKVSLSLSLDCEALVFVGVLNPALGF